jgi:ATP-dependent Lon protease
MMLRGDVEEHVAKRERKATSESIKKGLEIVPVSRMDEVLARAMTRKPIEWDETTTTAAAVPEEAPVEEEASTLTAH